MLCISLTKLKASKSTLPALANVASSGTAEPTDTTTFPDAYSPKQYPSYMTSVREDGTQGWNGETFDDYVPPGPQVYTGGGSSAPAGASGVSTGDSASGTVSGSETGSTTLTPPPDTTGSTDSDETADDYSEDSYNEADPSATTSVGNAPDSESSPESDVS